MINIEELNNKILINFQELAIDKLLVSNLRLREQRTIPSFVEEWLISKYSQPDLDLITLRKKITQFMGKHLPSKSDKEIIKHKLNRGESVVILDKYSIRVDIAKGVSFVTIPSLDITDALVVNDVIDENVALLGGGQWGAGKLDVTNNEKTKKQHVRLISFKPMQSGQVNLKLLTEARKQFSTEEWIGVILRTMGCEPNAYTYEERKYLILRLLPMIQNNLNMMELAPKGTGKSYIFANLSRHVWLNSGGALSEAQLFTNLSTKQLGLLGTNDLLVLDEGQSIQFRGADDIHAKFKAYLESGEFSRGQDKVTSECGLMILANIDLYNSVPKRNDYIRELPKMFHDDALLDRFHGIIPGWKIPRFTTDKIAQGYGLKADVFGEFLHQLRAPNGLEFSFGKVPEIKGDIRDSKAVKRTATALSKLLMLNPADIDYREFVLEPAIELRKAVRGQIAYMNPDEFHPEMQVQIEGY